MNKEQLLTDAGRELYSKDVVVSKWQVDEAIQIPVTQGYLPMPLCLPSRQPRAHAEKPAFLRRFAFFVAILLGSCASLSAKATQNVSISWDRSADPATAGYIVYAGSSPTNFTSQLNVGTNTTITLSGLSEGATNYFAVSAYNTANIISPPSAPIPYIVPGKLTMKSKTSTATLLSFATAPGHWYQVQGSTDMVNWTNLYQTTTASNNSLINYSDAQAGVYPRRFYRLLMH